MIRSEDDFETEETTKRFTTLHIAQLGGYCVINKPTFSWTLELAVRSSAAGHFSSQCSIISLV
jgi:hypothetical protein